MTSFVDGGCGQRRLALGGVHRWKPRRPDVRRRFDACLEKFGRLDILVNNAGGMFTKPVAEVGEEEFDRLFAVNVKGAFFCCQEAAKHLAESGRIINVSSSTNGPDAAGVCGLRRHQGGRRAVQARPRQRTRPQEHHRQRSIAGSDRHGVVQPGQE
jgi:NAD(P)-dependent dehydrogenase (short-subunit alcohol dehydrogenase family)